MTNCTATTLYCTFCHKMGALWKLYVLLKFELIISVQSHYLIASELYVRPVHIAITFYFLGL